jgi:hypothetical protein
MTKNLKNVLLTLLFAICGLYVYGQGVTTSAINGKVVDAKGEPVPFAIIMALHEPSGSTYGTTTLDNGSFVLMGLRVGGPYTVRASFLGYEPVEQKNVYLALGASEEFKFTLREAATELEEVVVVGARDFVFNSNRTGASSNFGQDALQTMPTISRRITDITRLSPMAKGSSFAGVDNRLNNITVDGSYFNNSFGLAGQPGDRTGVSPISLDAIEQITVNIAPYDVRQGNFVGAGVNTVTKSGTNEFKGSFYALYRNEDLVGKKAGEFDFNPGTFNYNQLGLTFGGPIIKNKLFFFASFERERLTEPGTTYRANEGGETVEGSVTRVLKSDLDALSTYLKNSFSYETGPYQGYDHHTDADKFLIKLDYNLNDKNKISLRYNFLNSETDVLLSNSSSLGFGTRRSNLNGLNFQNSNYSIFENIRSLIGEWNSRISNNMANNLIIGWTYQNEDRGSKGTMFPFVDILNGGSVYTSFGFEPFTPSNQLSYSSIQLQDNFTIFKENHTFTFGVSAEMYESKNVFFPGQQSAYVYNSLADFYTDANDYIANPDRTVSPINLRRFQVRYMAQPGVSEPVQPLKVLYAGIYAQDEWKAAANLRFTMGLRVDVPFFENTAYFNPNVPAMNFRDEGGQTVKYSTDKMPDSNPLFSPRIGFNWDVFSDRKTQVRGGSGIFTGRPAYVWISNQIGNNGVLTGFLQADNTTAYPFHPNIDKYKPVITTVQVAPTYELALTEPTFRFPQVWRSNLGIDQKLPFFGLIASVEALFSKDFNGLYYINANLPGAQSQYTGVDNRPRYTSNRINSAVTSAVVLKNQNVGYAYNVSASLEKPFKDGLTAKVAYSYGVAKNTVDPGSIAFGSWNNNQHPGDPNNPGLGFSATSPGHRVIASVSYRKEYFSFGATQFGIFWEMTNAGNLSYVYSGDLNGDGGTSNDLIYIPKDISEMNFQAYTVTVAGTPVTFSQDDQNTAWEAYIKQDPYLSKNRGKYVERNSLFLPMFNRADFSLVQEVFVKAGGTRNALQFRVDILNIGNLFNKDWGVAKRVINDRPLIVPTTAQGGPVDANGAARYRLAHINGVLVSETFQQTVTGSDVYRIQLGVRYIFN